MEPFNVSLPKWAFMMLRSIVHPDVLEEVEGDLLEKYALDKERYGEKRARLKFYSELISIVRLHMIFNLKYVEMSTRNWIIVATMTMALFLASVAPFLPGPRNLLSHRLSQFSQVIGYIGLVFVPFGLLWLIIEIQSRKNKKHNRWTNGYYPALLVLTPVFVFIPLQIIRSISSGIDSLDLWPLLVIILLVCYIIFRIQKLKHRNKHTFNVVPLCIVVLPLVSILSSMFAVRNVAAQTREEGIEKAKPLLDALESYRADHAVYPDKLEDLKGNYILELPRIQRMGSSEYHYEKRGETYQFSFEQFYHWYATEVVVYQKNGHEIAKANYENYPTESPDWRYYLAD